MRHIVLARQAAAWVLRRSYPSLALTDIGHLLDRDHTTIIYSISQIERKMADDPCLRAELHGLLPQRAAHHVPVRTRNGSCHALVGGPGAR
jgi:chromosomal replication initiation ATPase DnaA